MKVAFHTLGCKVNQNDTDSLARLFRERGYDIVPFEPGADIFVINTCTVTHVGEQKSRQMIHKAVGFGAKAVVITGCYPQVAPDEAAAISGVDLVVGMADRPRIVDMVEEFLCKRRKQADIQPTGQLRQWVNLPVGYESGRTRVNLKIEEGCDQYCTYCIIPYARGPVRSMPPGQVVEEFCLLLSKGYREIVLTGIHLGVYGKDIGIDLNEVLTDILKVNGDFRLRLGSIEPTDFTPQLIETVVGNPKVCQYLHIPLQSGSDSVLSRMNRGYNLQYYSKLLDDLRRRNPLLGIGTDLIVGFPGETEADFAVTRKYVIEQGFSRIHVFRYSPRKGTVAAEFSGRVPKRIQEERGKIIAEAAVQTGLAYLNQFVGRTVEVLFEESHGNIWNGLTGEYLRLEAETTEALRNIIKPVFVTEVRGNSLVGKIIDK